MSNGTTTTPALGDIIEIVVSGRVIARTESLTRGTTYLVEYGKDKRRDWFSEDAILEDDDSGEAGSVKGGGNE